MSTKSYTDLPDPEAEAIIYGTLHAYDDDSRLKYAQIGQMALAVSRRMLWRHRKDPADGLPCRSMARWIRIACPYAYSTVYAAMRDVEDLQDVPAEELAQIPQSNMRTMKQLDRRARRDPEVLRIAKSKQSEHLVAHIREHRPDLHIEMRGDFRLKPSEDQLAEIEEAITLALERGDASSKEEAVFMWAVNYRQECERAILEAAGKQVAHA